jgi:archaemetzincin
VSAGIYILNGSSALSAGELHRIEKSAASVFRLPVRSIPASLEPGPAYDRARGQYNSTVLLGQVSGFGSSRRFRRLAGAVPSSTGNGTEGDKFIAVVDADLFIPVLTYVFGEAELGGAAAIVSTHRLSNRLYGLPEDHQLFLDRVGKEIIHELGHLFGLIHCRSFECVMRSSTYVEEIDLKRAAPCASCALLLESASDARPQGRQPMRTQNS